MYELWLGVSLIVLLAIGVCAILVWDIRRSARRSRERMKRKGDSKA